MVSLDLKAGSTGAPALRRIRAQAIFDARTVLRNGENLLLTIVIPVGVLVLGLKTSLGGERTAPQALVSAICLGVLATAFTSQAISTGFDRRYGVLRLLGLSPLRPTGLLAARTCVSLLVIGLQLLILVGLTGILAGWWPTDPLLVLRSVVAILLAVWAFTAWALVLAGTLRAEATLAVANAVFLVLMFGGGLAIPVDKLPWPTLAEALPTGALWIAMESGGVVPFLVLAAWGGVGTVLAVRWFRWEA